jgi:hypothetical protein
MATTKILKIESVTQIEKNGVEIACYIFNNDKIVRVNNETDEVMTKNVPQKYIDLISVYSANTDVIEKPKKKKVTHETESLKEKIAGIQSGKGAGLGVFFGTLLYFTIIGPFIAGCCSIGFLNDISDKKYLQDTSSREINFRKGFYSMVLGWIVAIACCAQWKVDMISVLNDEPTEPSRNNHICFKVWFWINSAWFFIALIANLVRMSQKPSYTTPTRSTNSYYRTYK